ncbi:MAG: hypothetical protein HQK53_07125 [Oligoflexia bacterium]|nr:hypothetical protein [Oligoflexia bacterium]
MQQSGGDKVKIFIIDKIKFRCSMMELVLKSQGMEVFSVNSADDSLYLIKDLRPDLLILDGETISSTNDTTFLDCFRQSEEISSTPALVIGNDFDISLPNFKGFVHNPVSAVAIIQKVKEALNRP